MMIDYDVMMIDYDVMMIDYNDDDQNNHLVFVLAGEDILEHSLYAFLHSWFE
jgi:hypothetical protein